MTRTPLSRSRSPGRFTQRRVGASDSCSDERGNVLAVGNCCYIAVCSAGQGASAPRGGEGRGISWRPPAYSLLRSVTTLVYIRLPDLVLTCLLGRCPLFDCVRPECTGLPDTDTNVGPSPLILFSSLCTFQRCPSVGVCKTAKKLLYELQRVSLYFEQYLWSNL